MALKLLKIFIIILLLLALADAYVRLAPSDPARWNRMPGDFTGSSGMRDVPGGAIYESGLLAAPPAEVLTAIEARAMATPRTRLLAGSAGKRQMTFITRSRVFGFPDYTTVVARPENGGSRLRIYGRLRFGRSDLGVNRARISGWIKVLERFAQ